MKTLSTSIIFLFIISVFIIVSCKEKLDLPQSTTVGVKNPGIFTAKAYGSIFGRSITAKGFCWDTLNNPDLEKNVINVGEGSQSYSCEITGLTPGKTYYLRAFATNSIGTSLGTVTSFTTIVSPQVITNLPSALTYSTGTAGGFAASSASMMLMDAGICYGTGHNPDINGTKKSTGTSPNFNTTLNNLTENTLYYVRAYGTYNFGTVYGQEQNFKTASAPVVYSVSGSVTDNEGNSYNTVTIGNQTWMAENLAVTKYYSGVSIPLVGGGFGSWSNTSFGARCNYADNTAYTSSYGYMYNFRAILDPQGLAPAGWHIPSTAEWQILIDKLGGNAAAMQHFMDNHNTWSLAYCSPTNYSAMSLLPAGCRGSGGGDLDMNTNAYYWTSDYSGSYATYLKFGYTCGISTMSGSFNVGCYIRCVKD